LRSDGCLAEVSTDLSEQGSHPTVRAVSRFRPRAACVVAQLEIQGSVTGRPSCTAAVAWSSLQLIESGTPPRGEGGRIPAGETGSCFVSAPAEGEEHPAGILRGPNLLVGEDGKGRGRAERIQAPTASACPRSPLGSGAV
jgi:hypothetical protein